MTPKQWIKYIRRLERKGYAICDGVTEPMSISNILYPLFVITGIGFFMWLLTHWKIFRDKQEWKGGSEKR